MGFISNIFKGPPKPPSPEKVADAQMGVNRETALLNAALNRVDQNTPFGSLTYSQSGVDEQGNPQYTATQTLSPDQQAILDALERVGITAGNTAGTLLNNASGMYSAPFQLPELPDFSNAADSLVSQQLERFGAYMNPSFDRDIANLDAKMRNQGLFPGMPAYDQAMRTLRSNQGEQRERFAASTQQQAFTQQQQQYQTAVAHALKEYGLPLETINSLLGLSKPTSPSFVSPAPINTPGVDITGTFQNQYANELAQYNQGLSHLFSGLGYIGGLPTGGKSTIGGTLGAKLGGGFSAMLGLV